MEDLRNSLLQRAFCYDDPAAYRAGVDAALSAVSEALTSSESVQVGDMVDITGMMGPTEGDRGAVSHG